MFESKAIVFLYAVSPVHMGAGTAEAFAWLKWLRQMAAAVEKGGE